MGLELILWSIFGKSMMNHNSKALIITFSVIEFS